MKIWLRRLIIFTIPIAWRILQERRRRKKAEKR
jgi:hypothetical protein